MDARSHRAHAGKLEDATGAHEEHLVPIWRDEALSEVRGPSAIDDVVGRRARRCPLRGRHHDLGSDLRDLDARRRALDPYETAIVTGIAGEVLRALGGVRSHRVDELPHRLRSDLS